MPASTLSPLHLAAMSAVMAILAGCQGLSRPGPVAETRIAADGLCVIRDITATSPETGEPITLRRRFCGDGSRPAR